jgi:toxin FitB
MIVLDTNVVSALIRQDTAPRVVAWVDEQHAAHLFITAVTAAELLYGLARLPEGRRKSTMAAKVHTLLDDYFAERVLPFGVSSAPHYAEIVSARESRGRPISAADAQIAAICRLNQAQIATRNIKDFTDTGVTLVNPWEPET